MKTWSMTVRGPVVTEQRASLVAGIIDTALEALGCKCECGTHNHDTNFDRKHGRGSHVYRSWKVPAGVTVQQLRATLAHALDGTEFSA